MFSHVMVGSNDIDRSKTFYDALFEAIGGAPGVRDPKGRLVYTHAASRFMVTTPLDGAPATPANGGTIGFAMANAEQAHAWHAAGVANGGAGDRGRSRRAPDAVRPPAPRLPARSRRQQAVRRASARGGVTDRDFVSAAPQGKRTVGGSELRMLSTLPPVLSPNSVPRSWRRLNST